MKVAINGFGRIGRLAFRQMFHKDGIEIVAINDLTSPEMLAYLLKYDSAQKKYELSDTIESTEDSIIVDKEEIKILKEADPSKLPWKELDVDVVLECTGFFTSYEKASLHIEAGAKKVIISAPAGNIPTIVYGVNENTLTNTDNIISAASCTTNCLAPMAKFLNELAPITSGIMTTIHAYTGDQMLLDGPHRKGNLRRARAAAINIVPNSTGAAKAIGLVIPEPDGSLTILDAVVEKKVTLEEINNYMKEKQSDSYAYTEEEIVSSDIIGDTHGSIFDATQTKVVPLGEDKTLVQIVAWYDNENSYTSQMVRVAKYLMTKM